MKKLFPLFIILSGWMLTLSSCTTSPQKYFETAVLNANMLSGFAGDGFSREFESPSVKLVEGTKSETTPMKRSEVLSDKTGFIEEDLKEIKALKETDESKDIIKASLELYEYALPVLKTEYVQLAKAYDDGAPKETTQAITKTISDKYYNGFIERYDKLIAAGKIYAAKNNINVQWDIQTSPNLDKTSR